MENSRRLLVLGVAAAVLAGIQPWVWPLVGQAAEEWHERRSRLPQAAEVSRRVAEIRRGHGDLALLDDRLASVVPRGDDVSFALERLEALAQQRGLAVVVESIGEGEELTEGERVIMIIVPVRVSVSGLPAALLDYVSALEHLPELTEIQSIFLEPGEMYTAALDINFYVQPSHDEAH